MGENTQQERKLLYPYGKLDADRGELGVYMPVLFFRLFEDAARQRLDKEFSRGYADEVMRDVGRIAGESFAENFLADEGDAESFIASFRTLLKVLGYADMKVEKAVINELRFVFSLCQSIEPGRHVEEGDTCCVFTEGFLSGAFSSHFGTDINVKEIECVAGGAGQCRYIAGIDV